MSNCLCPVVLRLVTTASYCMISDEMMFMMTGDDDDDSSCDSLGITASLVIMVNLCLISIRHKGHVSS